MRPARVVAPTTVNGLSVSRRLRAAGPAADHHVDGEVLHRRVEDLLDRVVEAMDLIDEQDVALIEVGQDRGQVARPLDGRTAGGVDVHAELAGDDVGERRLAQAGRAVEQDVVGRFLALARAAASRMARFCLTVGLADVLGQGAGPKARLYDCLLGRQRARGDEAVCLLHRWRV